MYDWVCYYLLSARSLCTLERLTIFCIVIRAHPKEAPTVKGILVVDDSPTMRKMVIAALRGLPGASFHEAGNGLEAIELLALGQISLVISTSTCLK